MKSIVLIIALIASSVILAATGAATMAKDLKTVQEDVAKKYPAVEQMTTDQFAMLNAADVQLFDVRKKDEFDVSHIAGAVQIDPGTRRRAFMEKYEDQIGSKIIVFYCSVGHRSSKLANRVQRYSLEAGAAAVYNLEGGIFKWHNEERPLVRSDGATDFVHPYNRNWGALVDRQDLTRYQPD